MKFTHDTGKVAPVVLEIDPKPVYYIGPATKNNPMTQTRTKLLGNVYINDQKTKWTRITLHFTGKAGLNKHVETSSLPKEIVQSDLQESAKATTHLETTVTLCEIEKELIYKREKVIDFGFNLPPFLPPSVRTDHAFVEYTLTVVCSSSGPFSKKQKVTKPVVVCRHYLPSPNTLIPSVEYKGSFAEVCQWSAEVPKAIAVEAGEVNIALQLKMKRESIQIDQIELCIQELETYRFSTKSGVHILPPVIKEFPPTTSNLRHDSETHFIRVPIPKPIKTHHFDPFLEITHRLKLTMSTPKEEEPLVVDFPIIITDFPPNTTADYFVNDNNNEYVVEPTTVMSEEDEEVSCLDLNLPEYTPRYYESDTLNNT